MKKTLLYVISILAVLVIGTACSPGITRNSAANTTKSVIDLELTTGLGEPVSDENIPSGEATTEPTKPDSEIGSIPTADELVPNVSMEGFFTKIYNKVFVAVTGVQKIIAIILALFFCFSAVMVIVSCFGQKSKVPWYLLSLLICALCFVADIYAIPILNAFTNWFAS